MRHVPIAEFKDKMSEVMAAADAGEDVIITRHGKDYMKLVPVEADRMAKQRAAITALYELGQQIKARNGPTTPQEIREWIEEGRR
jgi:prevent-host-death family protein